MPSPVKFDRTVRRQGNSIGVSLPPEILKAAGLDEGSRVHVYYDEVTPRIVIERA